MHKLHGAATWLEETPSDQGSLLSAHLDGDLV